MRENGRGGKEAEAGGVGGGGNGKKNKGKKGTRAAVGEYKVSHHGCKNNEGMGLYAYTMRAYSCRRYANSCTKRTARPLTVSLLTAAVTSDGDGHMMAVTQISKHKKSANEVLRCLVLQC